MKQKKNLLGILLAVVMVICLSACGGGGRADSTLEGKYISVAGEALGMTMSGDDISGFTIELAKNGKGTVSVDNESGTDSGKCTWTNDDTTLTIKVEGAEIVGTLGTDTFTVDDFMGMGLKLIFAKEGTDAANPENYLPEEEKMMIGTWTSTRVQDVLGDDVSDEVSPTALTVEFRGDHTMIAAFDGKNLGDATWYLFGGDGYINEDEYLLNYWEADGDNIVINYNDGDNSCYFVCTKGK